MRKEIGTDIRLNMHTQKMPPVVHDKIHAAFEHIGRRHKRHHHKKSAVGLRWQELLHGHARNQRKGQINHTNHQGTGHVQCKKLPVRFII